MTHGYCVECTLLGYESLVHDCSGLLDLQLKQLNHIGELDEKKVLSFVIPKQ